MEAPRATTAPHPPRLGTVMTATTHLSERVDPPARPLGPSMAPRNRAASLLGGGILSSRDDDDVVDHRRRHTPRTEEFHSSTRLVSSANQGDLRGLRPVQRSDPSPPVRRGQRNEQRPPQKSGAGVESIHRSRVGRWGQRARVGGVVPTKGSHVTPDSSSPLHRRCLESLDARTRGTEEASAPLQIWDGRLHSHPYVARSDTVGFLPLRIPARSARK